MTIFPGPFNPSIVIANRLYGRVRDGNGCFPIAFIPSTIYIKTLAIFCQGFFIKLFLDLIRLFFQFKYTNY